MVSTTRTLRSRVTRFGISGAIAILLVGALVVPAYAATAKVRIEGAQRTVFAGSATLGTTAMTDSAGASHSESNNALSVLDSAARQGAFPYVLDNLSFGLFVSSIGGELPLLTPPYPGWSYRVNGVSPTVGADKYTVKDGDSVLWYYGAWDASPTAAVVPSGYVAVGTTSTVTAQQLDSAGKASALSGATVYFGSKAVTSAADGKAQAVLAAPGDYGVRVEKDGYIRSAIEKIKVRYTSKLSTPKASKTSVKKGKKVTVSGTLSGVGKTPASRTVTLQARNKGSKTWTTVSSKKANASGKFSFSVKVPKSRYYRVKFAGDSTFASVTSATSKLVKAR